MSAKPYGRLLTLKLRIAPHSSDATSTHLHLAPVLAIGNNGVMSKQQFQTEVSQLLQLIVHSLYSHPEIFLRELISNSSDALDKLRHLSLTDDEYKALVGNGIDSPRIDLELDEANKTLTVSDTGIGMNEEDLVSHLGTIARSGTKNFLTQLSGDARKDSNLIGQFGVGFYSAFMVADKVEVFSRKAGDDKTFKWTSDGETGFDIEEVSGANARKTAGTTILIHFNDEGAQYANGWRLQEIVRKYSNHIAFPIFLTYDKADWDAEKKESVKTRTTEQINAASAMWRRSKSELSDDDYKELYKSLTGGWEDPLFWFHTRAEGTLEYTTLFYIPAKAPLDLYQADYKGGVKLYVKRVFIMDDSKDLLPQYLRFVRGIIDSEDLPLNVSREILQQNKVLTSIKTASVKKILSELKTIATNDPEKYSRFIAEYNRPLKEGLYGDYANREMLLDLIRFKSTKVEGLTSLAEVKERMQPEQKALYYITGGSESMLRNSPLLEIYKKKGIEVFILDDDVDEIVFSTVTSYGDTDLKAVNKSSTSEDLKDDSTPEKAEELQPLLDKIKATIGAAVKEVRASSRLANSPSVIVSDEDEPSARMRQMMQAMGQKNLPVLQPTLEINPDHEIIRKLLADPSNSKVEDAAWLLFDQALILEGVQLKDPATFVQRLNRVLNQSI
ncbi:molecular chaperone HtpG [Edaphobacter aggregans]|uniref:Chaperone protein HtpG n=1 Tax=Edaphobacter aggregans TaxID=570835 RepID=A0A3R9QDX3_9BACT|nr:molecular chaperone HtpG [Edaphobacter aggregans]RSL19315.1 molecular chaperone HtpG [Edaphobacter aggregans]